MSSQTVEQPALAIGWDGESDLILFSPWIVKDVGPYPSYDDLVTLAQEEGMPPKVFCQLFDWLPAFFSRRRTEKIRQQGSAPAA